MGVCIVFHPLMKKWYGLWGTEKGEEMLGLPGDEIVPRPAGGYNQAIFIKAPPERIWTWLVQLGQDKAGYYSYEMLENIIGCRIKGQERIVPEFQNLKAGDFLIMHPKAPKIPVAVVQPPEVLVYGGRIDKDNGNVWTFYLAEKGGGTRLLVRWYFDYKRVLINRLTYNVMLEPIAAVMQRKQLLTLKRLVESQQH
jgi:hypothetical protein